MPKSRTLILAALLVAAPLAAFAQTEGVPPAQNRHIDLKSMTPEQLDAFLKQSFTHADRNADGFIDITEAPEKRMTTTKNGRATSEVAGKDLWIADYDQNKDKKVSWEEYRNFTVSLVKRAPR